MLDGATLFRNNGVTGNPYPFGNNLFSITGNHNYTAANPQLFQSFYFYLYDIQVKLAGTCPTNRAAITGTAPVAPVITQNGNVLTSNISTNIQWYRNGVAIPNAFSASYTATESGTYKAVIQNCPTAGSNEIVITITALIDLDAVQDGGVIVSPNPNNGNFELAFETRKTGNLSINIFNNLGQSIYQESRSNFTGLYQKDLKLAVQSGVYMLQIKHGNKIYSQKLIINR
jgi:hypothetical protein